WLKDTFIPSDRSIGDMQIQLLAPEYPTTALNWYGANCCICWKTWKGTVAEVILKATNKNR
ncbi:MAG: hypothetical protein RR234_06985, partial [Christensenella sp.]